jgi:NADH:ubiquinone oxidoreductase subunit 3 (subunit A)
MNSLLVLFIFVPILVIILLALNLLFAVHKPDSEKVTAYECGFSPIYGQTRSPFYIQFYNVAMLFLIFDLEILLLFPIAVTLYQVNTYGFWIAMIFFGILTVGFVYEIGSGILKFTDQRSSLSQIERPLSSSVI